MKVLDGLTVRGLLALSLLLMLVFVQSVLAETTQFAYGVNAGDWSVTQYRVNPETGALRHNGHQPVIKFPVALAVHPSKRFVVTAVKTTAKVAVFQVDPLSGRLAEIPQSPFSVSNTPSAAAASPYSQE